MRVILAMVMATLTLGLAPRPMHGLQTQIDVSPVETIRMVDAQSGWAVTARCGPCPPHVVSGLMLRTTSGGTQWKDVTPVDSSGQRSDVAYFYVFDSHTAWAVATTGVFRTVDGGRTWKSMTVPAGGVRSISFINPREGWLLASLGVATGHEAVVIYRSSDGGETWSKLAGATLDDESSGLPFTGDKSAITFLNATTGWITGGSIANPLYLYVTQDGGRTWRPQSLPLHPQLMPRREGRNIQPPKPFSTRDAIIRTDYAVLNDSGENVGMVVVFHVSNDSGRKWTYREPVRLLNDFYPSFYPSSFAEINHGWVMDGNDLNVTSDGGRSWTKIRSNEIFNKVTQLDFISPKVGWAVRNTHPFSGSAIQTAPFLLKTLDAGRNWTPVTYTILR